MMIWAAKVANQPVEQQQPGTWYSYLRRRLQSRLLVALVVIGIFGLTGERVPLYSHMYVFVLSASLASDGLEFVLKAAWRKLRPPKTTT